MLGPYFLFLPIFVISLWHSSRNDNPSHIYMSLLSRTKLEDKIKKKNTMNKKEIKENDMHSLPALRIHYVVKW